MNVKVFFDSHKFKTWLNSIEFRELPYAEASALNGIAFRVQKYVRANLRKKYTLRNNWTEKGIQVDKATKHHRQAAIGTRDQYLARHEEGGTFFPSGSKSFSIPLADAKRNKKNIVPRSKWPSKQRAKGVRIVESKRGRLLMRFYKSKKPDLLFAFERKIRIKPTLGLVDTAGAVGSKFMETEFQLAFSRALGGRP